MPLRDNLSFVHRFEPPGDTLRPVTLLLLGTGGDENDLLPVGRELWPGAALLAERGNALKEASLAFFTVPLTAVSTSPI